MSYVFGAADDAPVIPKDYDSVAELKFLSRAVMAVLEAPGTLCYFNPNGEVLRDLASFRREWDGLLEHQFVPHPLWANIRFFHLNEKFGFMDTVGNGQLDVHDVEAVYPSSNYDPNDVGMYLRNVTSYLLELGRDMRSGESIDGPGETNLKSITEVLDQGVIDPPRRVLRLYPKANAKAVHAAVAAASG